MYDVKTQIKVLLESIEGITVSDAYPTDFKKLPHISFYESTNLDPLKIKASPLSDITIQIDIWHNRSTGSLAQQVDDKMASIGFRREFAADVPDSAVKRKTMRFHGVVDTRSEIVYQ
ncbi:MAG: hypothetical protein NC238_03005 [Dehalobacter sp.]|nr:hypothetical protein [Dehalobacter sp.]